MQRFLYVLLAITVACGFFLLGYKLANILGRYKKPSKENSIATKLRFDLPSAYHAIGTLHLPYDNIREPFESWYARDYNMSRIDYYYGMDKTFQRGDLMDYGVLVKVVPAHWGRDEDLDKNTISCWYRPGFRWSQQRGQSVLPAHLEHFKFIGEEIRSGMPTFKYQRNTTIFHKKNSYTFWMTKAKPHRPLRYVMHGYDTLLNSFYDHYVMDYLSFQPWKFDFEVMKIPKGTNCEQTLNKLKSKFHFNPMSEFMHENFDDAEVIGAYEHFKQRHNKSYPDVYEHQKRVHIFRHNMRYIRSHNRARLNFTLAPNEFADMTDEEFESYKGLLIDPSGSDDALKRQEIPEIRFNDKIEVPLPDNLDWRDYGAVTPAKAQGRCGSCWTFSAMGPIEGAYALKTGKLKDFSEQQLLDCSWGFGNNGCRGGFSWRGLVWARKFGVTSSRTYGRYLAQEGYCHCAKTDKCDTVHFERVMTVPKYNQTALRRGLALYGPASIAINVNRKSLKFYSGGVYDDPQCPPNTNHGVVVVGYGVEEGQPYWIVKNSWGKFWGEQGFIRISRKKNQCGVVSNEPIFVVFDAKEDMTNDNSVDFPFQRMDKVKFVDDERFLNVSALKLSPFDYKRSHIDLWTPPVFISGKKRKENLG
ncbi:counting factor associated protein D isoform X2 [Nematostella vectensis]|uniref:counting factor associated protein D isoform X2 n=1 Tax=Nematostella vectensis TaxID=45351 RepID=UPI0020777BBF|nr:counting factor associated protein D isoform X2 [Nematostella vectensis]